MKNEPPAFYQSSLFQSQSDNDDDFEFMKKLEMSAINLSLGQPTGGNSTELEQRVYELTGIIDEKNSHIMAFEVQLQESN